MYQPPFIPAGLEPGTNAAPGVAQKQRTVDATRHILSVAKSQAIQAAQSALELSAFLPR
jgi:hypothetical protein